MSQSFTHRARLAYYLAWIPMSALVVVVLNLRGHPWWEALTITLPVCVLYSLVCSSSYYMARAMPLRRTRLMQVLLSLIGASALAGGGWIGLAYTAAQFLPAPASERLADQLGLLYGLGVGFFLLSLVFHYLVLALEETRQAERQTDEVRLLKREAELRALRAQINPHFLFNSLNSIAALTAIEPEQARSMCQLLSDFFRTTLRLGDRSAVPLGEELALVRNYLDIERVRFEDRMQVSEHIDPDCLNIAFPPLLLQPLLENAVKHGVSNMLEGGRIDLEVSRDGDRIQVVVENPFDPEAPARPGNGHGLSIVEERLAALYGDLARIVVNKSEDRYRVELKLPTQGAKNA